MPNLAFEVEEDKLDGLSFDFKVEMSGFSQ